MIIGHRPSPFCSGSFKLDSKGTILGNVIKIRNPSSNGWGAEDDIFLSLEMHMTLQCAMENGREVWRVPQTWLETLHCSTIYKTRTLVVLKFASILFSYPAIRYRYILSVHYLHRSRDVHRLPASRNYIRSTMQKWFWVATLISVTSRTSREIVVLEAKRNQTDWRSW
jgi:hypothetical protein